jgi:hypothetical protein
MAPEPRNFPAPPIHPLAALVTIVLDGVFGVIEIFDPLILLFTSLGLGFLGFLSTTFVQRFLANDSWGAAVAKGMAMGIVAGVPYPVTGTAVGVPLLAWSGLHQWLKLPGGRNNQLVDEAIQRAALEDKEKNNEA